MSSPIATLVLIAGIALLGLGADVLIRGAVTVAKSLRISAAVIGLTIVSMGTSLPELTVSVAAALRGSSDLALGNAIGSNLFNIGVVLGLSAIILPMRVHGSAVKLEWPFMFLASFQLLMLARDGHLDRLEGGFFVTGLALFTWYAVLIGRRAVSGEEAADLEYEVSRRAPLADLRSLGGAVALIAAGIALLVFGGDLLVRGATTLARAFGMTERMIALTVVAMGTGAPEAFTSIVAARRGQSEIALGNVIGSNIFNILGILGVTALVRPLSVSAPILHGDLWWMLGVSLLLFPIMRSKGEITRFEGAVLLVAYGTYLVLTAFIH